MLNPLAAVAKHARVVVLSPLSPLRSLTTYVYRSGGRGEDPFFLKRRRFTVPPLFRTFPPLFSTFLPLFWKCKERGGVQRGGEGSYFTLELPWGQRGEDRTHTHTQENEKEGEGGNGGASPGLSPKLVCERNTPGEKGWKEGGKEESVFLPMCTFHGKK